MKPFETPTQCCYQTPMDDSFCAIPWNTSAAWQEANTSLKHVLQHQRPELDESFRLAHGLHDQLTSIFPLMDRLCRTTCPDCVDVCCQRAWVWADFKDLLFLHLAGIPVPDHQLLFRQEDHCRYASPDGCRLDRIQRPFVCTWYLCPAQTQHLRQAPAEMKRITEPLQQIKACRKKMEISFIRTVS